MIVLNCFKIYYMPVFVYIKRVSLFAVENDYEMIKFSLSLTAVTQALFSLLKVDFFGVSNLLLLLVLANVLIDAHFGIKKSLLKSNLNKALSESFPVNSIERRHYARKSDALKFKPKKLQYTFFKCITLLLYLFFAKNLLEVQDGESTLAQVIGFASGIVIKAPIAIFWYYDFKSIGDNTAFIYSKKAPIFVIIEKMFEPRLKTFFEAQSSHGEVELVSQEIESESEEEFKEINYDR